MKKTVLKICVTVLLMVCLSSLVMAEGLKIGDVLSECPYLTTSKAARITEDGQLPQGAFTLEWEAYEGAAGYSVRVFFNISSTGKDRELNFIYVNELATDTTSVRVEGLEINRRYTVIVYALDADGNELAVYDRVPVSTLPHTEEEPADEAFDGRISGGTLKLVLIITAAVTVAGLAVMAVIIAVSLRKKK